MTQFGRPATQPVRIVAILLYLCVFGVNILFRMAEPTRYTQSMGETIGLIVGLTALITLELFEQATFTSKPTRQQAILSLLARLLLTEFVGQIDNNGFYRFLYMLPPVIGYLYIGRWTSYTLAIFNFGLSILGMWLCCGQRWWLTNDNLADTILIFVGLVFGVLMARTVALQEKTQEKTEALLEELKASQQQIASLAAVNERNRIARDIHDSVGHHLTAVNIQLEKAITFQQINPTEASQALHDAKRAARAALTDVRHSVSTLRDTERPFALTPALQQLINGFGNLPTQLHIEGDEANIAKPTLMALYRAAQEGLTNIEKHAQATQATLRVQLQPQHATLILQDNGTGINAAQLTQKAASRDGHFGLTGLRERLELLGGTLTISRQQPHGTMLQVRIPAQGLT